MNPNYPYGYYYPPPPGYPSPPRPNNAQSPPNPPPYGSPQPNLIPSVLLGHPTPHQLVFSNPQSGEALPNYGTATSSPWTSQTPYMRHPWINPTTSSNTIATNNGNTVPPTVVAVGGGQGAIKHWECQNCPTRRNAGDGYKWCGVCRSVTNTAWVPGP